MREQLFIYILLLYYFDENTNMFVKEDKKTIEADPRKLSVQEVFNLFDRHSRQLVLKDSIQS